MSADVANLGVGVDVSAVIRATQALNSMADSAVKAGTASDQLVAKMNSLQTASARVQGASGGGGFGGLGSAANDLLGVFGRLERAVFSLQGIMMAFGIERMISGFKSAIMTVDEFRRTTIAIAATLTDTSKAQGSELKEVYDRNLRYARSTYKALEIESAKHFASGKEMVQAWQILSNKGIVLTSKEDIGNLGTVVDKIKLLTQGQVSSIQVAQELRSVLQGTTRASDQLALSLKDKLGASWKKQLLDAQASGNVLKWLAEQYSGLAAASGDITQTLAAQGNTLKTVFTQTLREGLWNTYDALVKIFDQLNKFMFSNQGGASSGISSWMDAFVSGFSKNGGGVSDAIEAFKNFMQQMPEYNDKFREMGGLARDLWETLGTAGKAIGSFLGTALTGWNSLPDVIKEYGIIFAVIGGAKAHFAIGLGLEAIGVIKGMYDAAGGGAATPEEANVQALTARQKVLSKTIENSGVVGGFSAEAAKQTGKGVLNWVSGNGFVVDSEQRAAQKKEYAEIEKQLSVSVLDQLKAKLTNLIANPPSDEPIQIKTEADHVKEAARMVVYKQWEADMQLYTDRVNLYQNVVPGSKKASPLSGITPEEQAGMKSQSDYEQYQKTTRSKIEQLQKQLKNTAEGKTQAVQDLEFEKEQNLKVLEGQIKAHPEWSELKQWEARYEAGILDQTLARKIANEEKKLANKAVPGARDNQKTDTMAQSAWDNMMKVAGINGADTGQSSAVAAVNKKYDEMHGKLEELKVGYKGTKLAKIEWTDSIDKSARAMEKANAEREDSIRIMGSEQKQLDELAKYGGDDAKNAASLHKIELSQMIALRDAYKNNSGEQEKINANAETAKTQELSKQKQLQDQQLSQLAKMNGQADISYKYLVDEVKEKQKAVGLSQQQLDILKEQENRLAARANMDVGALVDYGLKDAAVKAYDDLANKIGNAIPSALDTLSQSVSGNFSAMISGSMTAGQAFANMGKTMQQSMLQLVIDIGMAILKLQMLKGLAAAGINIPTSMGGIGTVAQAGQTGMNAGDQGGFNLSTSDIVSGASKVPSLLNSGGAFTSTSQIAMGTPAYSSATSTYTSSMAAGATHEAATSAALNAGNSVGGASASGSMSGVLGGAVGGAGVGYMAGGFMRPDNPMPSYVGAGAGLVAGGLAAMPAIGGLGALGATGVGALVAIPAALGMALLTPDTVKTEKTGNTGINVDMSQGGTINIKGYEEYRKTTSGLFGSQKTEHFTRETEADPALVKAWNDGIKASTDSLKKNLDVLGMGKEAIDNWTFPQGFDVDQEHLALYLQRIDNGMGSAAVEAAGLVDEFNAVALEGEKWGDEIRRLGTAMQDMHDITIATGFSFEKMTAGMSTIIKADYIYQLEQAAGGVQNIQAGLAALTKHTMTDSGRIQNAIADLQSQAQPRLNELGADFGNFWDQMQAAMSTQLDPETFAKWVNVSQTVDKMNTLQDSLNAVAKAAESAASASRQFDLSLEARMLSAKGFTYQAELASQLASAEAELTAAREQGMSQAQLSRLAEVQEMEKQAIIKKHYDEGVAMQKDFLDRIATATGDKQREITNMIAARDANYLKVVWEYGYELANLSTQAFNAELTAKIAGAAETLRLAKEAFAYDIDARKLVIAGKEDEAGALRLIAQEANELRTAIANGMTTTELDSLMEVQRQELSKYWEKLVEDLKSAADAIRKTVLDLKAGDKSTLPPDQRYALLKAQFDADVLKGMGGDRDAIAEAQSLASQVLDAKLGITTDQYVYADTFNEVTSALNRLADTLTNANATDATAAAAQAKLVAISQASLAYTQAQAQALSSLQNSLQGRATQTAATTGGGWGSSQYLTGQTEWSHGMTGLDWITANPSSYEDFFNYFGRGKGTGYVDWNAALTMWQSSQEGLDPQTQALYTAMQAALDNLKAIRGYASGGLVSTPQLAMVAESGPEMILPMGQFNALLSGNAQANSGGNNGEEVRALRQEVVNLRKDLRESLAAIAKSTQGTEAMLKRCGAREGTLNVGGTVTTEAAQ